MTIYRCPGCGKEVKVTVTEVPGISEVELCEVCLNVAEEESHEKGMEEGRKQGYDEAMNEVEEDKEK